MIPKNNLGAGTIGSEIWLAKRWRTHGERSSGDRFVRIAWFGDLTSGRATTLSEIAEREGVTRRYVGHLLPLAFLDPGIVEAILAGAQPADLTAQTLIKRTDLPLSWAE